MSGGFRSAATGATAFGQSRRETMELHFRIVGRGQLLGQPVEFSGHFAEEVEVHASDIEQVFDFHEPRAQAPRSQ